MAEKSAIDLSGRTVLITGASSGLGKRFAQAISNAGGNVVLAARRVDRLQALQDEIEELGGRAISVEMDVSSESSTIAAYDAAEAAFGSVDSVVANAGMNSEGSALGLAVGEFDRLMEINLRGVFLTAREGARRMISADSVTREHGRIVLISSITAQAVTGMLAAYSASKAAVLQMGKVFALEWARKGINVNIVCPGYISTELNSEWFTTEGGHKQIGKWPRRRLMREEDLDEIVLYLASNASRSVTGSVFTIDDGQSL